MEKDNRRALELMALVAACCGFMAVVETVIEPGYWVKSALKVAAFLVVPLVVLRLRGERVFPSTFALDRRGVAALLLLGIAVYGVVFGGYLLTRGVFDYAALVGALSADQKVSPDSFLWVALYISFGNSLLEEFLFRLVAFLKLGEYTTKRRAYLFSSVLFALYHIGMIGSSFPPLLLVLAVAGLAVGGGIFDYVDDRLGNIYPSWVVHMFADFAIMTIWYLYI